MITIDINTWLASAWNWGVSHWILIGIFLLCGGGALLAAPVKWSYNQLPYRRRELLAREERRAVEAARRKQEKAEAQKRHRENCRCGADCDGYKECEKHHPDCNCIHRSYCVCEVEEDCDCECRCECRNCNGFRTPGPLGRKPQSAEPTATLPAEPGSSQSTNCSGSRAPATSNMAARPAPMSWNRAHVQWQELCEQYATYECDPRELLRLPALADVTFGPTAAFIETFYEAQQLLTDQEPVDAHRAKRFVDAVTAATAAWKIAHEAAQRIRISRYSEHEQALLRRALSSLNLAQSATEPGERAQGYARAAHFMQELATRTEASGRWRMPEKGLTQIEASARLQLDSNRSQLTTPR